MFVVWPADGVDGDHVTARLADAREFLDPDPRFADMFHDVGCDHDVRGIGIDRIGVFASDVGHGETGIDARRFPTDAIVADESLQVRVGRCAGAHFQHPQVWLEVVDRVFLEKLTSIPVHGAGHSKPERARWREWDASINRILKLHAEGRLCFAGKLLLPSEEDCTVSEAAVQVEPEIRKRQRPRAGNLAAGAFVVCYVAVWAMTGAHFMADTNVYAQAILRHQAGAVEADYRLLTSNPFWDFGHLLWRPSGWLGFWLMKPFTLWIAHGNERAEVLLTLFGINFLASAACVLLFFLLAKRIVANQWSALIAGVGLFSADAFLDYAHSGNAYVVGLAFLVAGMYFSWSENVSRLAVSRAAAAGVMFALAVLFWFPYAFVLPAAVAGPLVIFGNEKPRRRLAAYTLAVCAGVGLVVYASVIVAIGIRNFTDLKEWILAAGHGQIQPGGFRSAARLAFSLPRSFISMGRDGMLLKRYLVHDPYAPVSFARLLGLSLWKPGLFYAAAGAVCLELLRSRRSRAMLFVLFGAVPILFFAVFIFEAGSIERYLPLYPFVFLAVGYILADKQASRASKAVVAASLIALIAVNGNAMRRGTLEEQKAEAIARIHELLPLLRSDSLVLAVNEQDSLAQFRQNFPMDPINLDTQWRTYDVLEINTERLATWRLDLAKRVHANWERGGSVWLPARFLSATPKPDWNWVEGDDSRIRWTDIPSFFSRFDVGLVIGGEDGFALWQDTPRNRDLLASLIQISPAR
jgi:4-amino-4-deoxy-L-arabinose transferase-like glycosyltransferase